MGIKSLAVLINPTENSNDHMCVGILVIKMRMLPTTQWTAQGICDFEVYTL